MEQKESERLLEVLRWLLENPFEQTMLCGVDSATARDVQESIEKLEAQGYYEWIPLLLFKHQDEPQIYRATAQYLANRLSGFFRDNGAQTELALFKALLAEQFA